MSTKKARKQFHLLFGNTILVGLLSWHTFWSKGFLIQHQLTSMGVFCFFRASPWNQRRMVFQDPRYCVIYANCCEAFFLASDNTCARTLSSRGYPFHLSFKGGKEQHVVGSGTPLWHPNGRVKQCLQTVGFVRGVSMDGFWRYESSLTTNTSW